MTRDDDVARIIRSLAEEAQQWLEAPVGVYPFSDHCLMEKAVYYAPNVDRTAAARSLNRVETLTRHFKNIGQIGTGEAIEKAVTSIREEMDKVDGLEAVGRTRELAITPVKEAVRRFVVLLESVADRDSASVGDVLHCNLDELTAHMKKGSRILEILESLFESEAKGCKVRRSEDANALTKRLTRSLKRNPCKDGVRIAELLTTKGGYVKLMREGRETILRK